MQTIFILTILLYLKICVQGEKYVQNVPEETSNNMHHGDRHPSAMQCFERCGMQLERDFQEKLQGTAPKPDVLFDNPKVEQLCMMQGAMKSCMGGCPSPSEAHEVHAVQMMKEGMRPLIYLCEDHHHELVEHRPCFASSASAVAETCGNSCDQDFDNAPRDARELILNCHSECQRHILVHTCGKDGDKAADFIQRFYAITLDPFGP